MKLAEALIARSDLQKKFLELQNRITNNVTVQDDDKPSEDPEVLISAAISVLMKLEHYIRQINKTNSLTMLPNGSTITEAIAKRDVLKMEHALYNNIANAATNSPRYSRNEIKTTSIINVVNVRKRADEIAKTFREWDTMIQGVNWNVDLIEE